MRLLTVKYPVLFIIIIAVLSRMPYLLSPNLLLDGDECVIGLMARHMYEGKGFSIFFWGQQYLDSGYASILNATTPLWGVIAAHFLTSDEKATPARIFGVLVGLAGIIVMVGPSAMKGLTHNLFAQIAQAPILKRNAIEGDRSGRRLNKAGQQLNQGGFACA